MARNLGTGVQIDGMREVRKALRDFEPDVRREFRRDVFKDAADLVASRARAYVPRRTGRLAASYRGSTSGFAGVVRSSLPYANFVYWGGTTGRGHSGSRPGNVRLPKRSFTVNGQTVRAANPAVHIAFDRNKDAVERLVVDGIIRVGRRNGWA